MLFSPPSRPLLKLPYIQDANPLEEERVEEEEAAQVTLELDSVKKTNAQVQLSVNWLFGALSPVKSDRIETRSPLKSPLSHPTNTELHSGIDWLFGALSPVKNNYLEPQSPIFLCKSPQTQVDQGCWDSDDDTLDGNDESQPEKHLAKEISLSRRSSLESCSTPPEPGEYRLNKKCAVTGIRIPAFCCGESPWKYLRRLRMLRSHSAPRVLITSSNLVFSSASLTSAELFLPTQRQRRGRWHQSTGWAKVADGRYEVITEREGRWYYLGTYAGVGEPRMIDPRAFISMGDKVKNAIYRETLNGADDRLSKSVGGMYGRGMLRALKIGLEYIGYNEKLADELARSVRDRPDRHAKRRAGRRSGTGVEGR